MALSLLGCNLISLIKLCAYNNTGGMLYLSLLEGQDETWEEESRFAGVLRFFAHYTSQEFETLLTQAGFSLVECSRDVADSAHTWLNFLVRN
jgi:hypothetical protein